MDTIWLRQCSKTAKRLAINHYLDTSIIAALYLDNPISKRVEDYINQHRGTLYVSAWTHLELGSALNRLVHHEGMDARKAREISRAYVDHLGVYFTPQPVTLDCFASAQAQLERFSTPLKAPDALHLGVIAQMQRLGLGSTTLVTNDSQMARAAVAFGLLAYHLTD